MLRLFPVFVNLHRTVSLIVSDRTSWKGRRELPCKSVIYAESATGAKTSVERQRSRFAQFYGKRLTCILTIFQPPSLFILAIE